jgi:hypothetical protein
MSRLTSTTATGKHSALLDAITSMTTNENHRYSEATAHAVCSLESADHMALEGMRNSFAAFRTSLIGAIQGNADIRSSLGLESHGTLPQAQLASIESRIEAAGIIMLASQAPSVYLEKLRKPVVSTEGMMLHEHAGVLSQEAFDSRIMEVNVEVSVAYQLLAAKQDKFAETLFHPLVLTPDQAGYRATIERHFVTTGAKHRLDGGALELKKHNILEAFRNPEILKNDSTELIPVVTTENSKYYLDNSVWAHETINVDGYDLVTAPIAIDSDNYSLLALTMHEGLISGGMFNQNDSIDHNLRLETIIFEVKGGSTTERFEVKVANNPTSQFLKTREQSGTAARLTFRSSGIRVNAQTKLRNGSASTLLSSALAGVDGSMNLEVAINADIALDRGTVRNQQASAVRKLTIDVKNGKPLQGEAHAGTKDLQFKVIGLVYDGRRLNKDLRTKGLLADADIWSEMYQVGTLPPVTVQRPRGEVGTRDLEILQTIVNVSITNDAVAKLQQYRDHVADYFVDNISNTSTADYITGGDVEGIARMVITPYFEELTLDLPKIINSIQSSNKLNDTRTAIVDIMTEACYRMIQRTGYAPALSLLNGGAERKIKIAVATDNVLPQYVMINGDDRTVGPVLDLELVSSPNINMLGNMYLVFVTDSKDWDPMHFGNLLLVPELVSKYDVSTDGQHLTHTTVHPRYRYINNVPAMIHIKVTGLTDLIQKRVSLDVNSTLMNPEQLPGGTQQP